MKIKLTHTSCHPTCSGIPGDIVDAPDDLAKSWIDQGGAVATDEPIAEVENTVDATDQPVKKTSKVKGK